ncbi:dicarboxylate transporter/tellurite-resistance protein TehA [Paraburkholderia sp.]|uniref:SLAC1 family transporter n=1 Tax=Paraburkholderia sp. TaxID=1926495 RepID=UPI0025D1B421|nr:dicarboxylate transporter/tellurite-resistance protein TehA [Paraburkholderia sp.]
MFSVILGLSGLGQSWRVAEHLWGISAHVGEDILVVATVIWASLLCAYIVHAIRRPDLMRAEFEHPVAGGTPALAGIATFLISQAVTIWSTAWAWGLLIAGICWQLAFSAWHTGTLWRGERRAEDTTPTLYLPTVAGSFTSAAAFGALNQPSWAWLLLGTGVFSWLALEPLIIQRLWSGHSLPVAQRSLLGIQFAPPVVCAAAILVVAPGTPQEWLLMLLGYGLFQTLVGLRLKSWLKEQPFGYAWWAFSFGVVSGTVVCLKLAVRGVPSAISLSWPVFIGANLFIGYLSVRTAWLVVSATIVREHPSVL